MKEELISTEYKLVPLAGGKYAIIDGDDFNRVFKHKWCLNQGYVITRMNNKNISLHRFIMNVTDPKIHVDHKFHNTLDNRKSQLRVCSSGQNQMNCKPREGCSSKYKGVSWYKRKKMWMAQVTLGGSRHYLGYFENEAEAAKAYDTKAKELFGEFANLNFK